MITTCEAPRCDAPAVELVAAHGIDDRYPGLLVDSDGAVRYLLCSECAAQLADAVSRVDRSTLLSYSFG